MRYRIAMNMQYKKGVFEEKCEEYWKARKKRKSVILSSLVEVTGLTRKACIKRMRFLQLLIPYLNTLTYSIIDLPHNN